MKLICKNFKENKNGKMSYVCKHKYSFMLIVILIILPIIIYICTSKVAFISEVKDWYIVIFPLVTIILTTVKSSDDLNKSIEDMNKAKLEKAELEEKQFKEKKELEEKKLEEERKLYRPTFYIEGSSFNREKLVVYTNSKNIMIRNIKIYNLSTNKFLGNEPLKKWGEVIISLNDKDNILILCESGIGEVILFSRINNILTHMYLDSTELSYNKELNKWEIYNNIEEISKPFIKVAVLEKTQSFIEKLVDNKKGIVEANTLKSTIKNIIDYLILEHSQKNISTENIKYCLKIFREELSRDVYIKEDSIYKDINHKTFISENERNLKAVSAEFYESASSKSIENFDTYFKFFIDNIDDYVEIDDFIEAHKAIKYGLINPWMLFTDFCNYYKDNDNDSIYKLKTFFFSSIFEHIKK